MFLIEIQLKIFKFFPLVTDKMFGNEYSFKLFTLWRAKKLYESYVYFRYERTWVYSWESFTPEDLWFKVSIPEIKPNWDMVLKFRH